MLNRDSNSYLLKTLCAILMILPQGKISHMLKNRLEISRMQGKEKLPIEDRRSSSNKKNQGLQPEDIELYQCQYLETQKKIQKGK